MSTNKRQLLTNMYCGLLNKIPTLHSYRSFYKHAVCRVEHRAHFWKSSSLSFHLTWYWFIILAGFNGPLSGIRAWAWSLLAALAVWVPFSFIPLIVEQFYDIDKLQVWYSEGGKGQLRVNGGALGYDAHLDPSIRQSYVVEGVFMGLVINHKTG